MTAEAPVACQEMPILPPGDLRAWPLASPCEESEWGSIWRRYAVASLDTTGFSLNGHALGNLLIFRLPAARTILCRGLDWVVGADSEFVGTRNLPMSTTPIDTSADMNDGGRCHKARRRRTVSRSWSRPAPVPSTQRHPSRLLRCLPAPSPMPSPRPIAVLGPAPGTISVIPHLLEVPEINRAPVTTDAYRVLRAQLACQARRNRHDVDTDHVRVLRESTRPLSFRRRRRPHRLRPLSTTRIVAAEESWAHASCYASGSARTGDGAPQYDRCACRSPYVTHSTVSSVRSAAETWLP